MNQKVPEFSKEAVVTSIGIGIVQALDFLADEMNLTEKDTQKLWSPFLAATTRMVKPADDMVAMFLRAPKIDKVKKALSNEFNSPDPEFYAPFNDSLRSYLKTLVEAIGENCYLPAVQNQSFVSKPQLASELMDMLNFFINDQNSKGRKIQGTDEAFKIVLCTVLPQHVEDTMQGNSLNGVSNTGRMIELGQVVFGTALLLQIISGMLD
jgi:ubiquitin C-terminal hydrolase